MELVLAWGSVKDMERQWGAREGRGNGSADLGSPCCRAGSRGASAVQVVDEGGASLLERTAGLEDVMDGALGPGREIVCEETMRIVFDLEDSLGPDGDGCWEEGAVAGEPEGT